MAASYSILMVHGEAEIGNSYDAQRSDGSSSVSRPRNIQTANINGGSHRVLSQIACAFGHDSIMQRENSESWGFATIETSGPEAELFALAEKVEFDTEIRRLASTRATSVIGLKLKASYASTDSKLADSIVVDILQF
jgi:hypothetical protein